MTVQLTIGGNKVDAEKMDFKTLDDAWSVIRLEDGTVIKIKVVPSEVYKLPAVDELTGVPMFVVKSSNVMSVEPQSTSSSSKKPN